ncbi:BirA family biotin operon repressor/biotin-[acetyl-CoA-carboxylase] ligase [Lederbergia galactosidilyticus]|uniref:biotin--[acetyl-CoA-carboxylase] ligase n=1 Tax=Lederbergia galactosidilytica TaxID=217031 RepID=UPI000FFEFF8E|nr:biotin--[acetyl-CoA-carboxylase] ligase [Lederbergia galactosidilytica]MBP1914612.1 BirA family biotin operon repressor/biotin-[acetyl-CoA-carboxylase] ligase [Lederbergia galactosidilytica]
MGKSIKRQMFEALAEAEGHYLSGQRLADLIGCSRTAIWKNIEELRKSGIEIEAVRKKGYRLIHLPDGLTENEILYGLETKILGKKVFHFDTTPSTQLIAHQEAAKGAPEGTMIVSEEQTSGKGRMLRDWHSSKQKGIWMSLILRPILPLEKAPQFTLIAAIAVAKAIEDITGLEPQIKWPNDLLLNGKKVTGILTELQGEADQINYLIIGMGINVNQESKDFPDELQEKATSLLIESGEKIKRKILVQHILKNLEKYYLIYIEKGFTPIKIIWEAYAVSIGKTITAQTSRENITGIAEGITNDGVLMIRDRDNQLHYIYSADILIH